MWVARLLKVKGFNICKAPRPLSRGAYFIVENNFLGATSSDKLDKAVEKIKNGDKSLAAANELITLENADKRSDATCLNLLKTLHK